MGKLGWLAAGMLSFFLTAHTWALDLDHEIARQDSTAAQIMSTLGRDKKPNVATSKKTNKEVQVRLIKSRKARKRA